ncbi:RnfABCDGE type electron transport complex subunit G [Patescibacteria group bacterium]|nr:RnfABCDGE type electron transport complex subunit G [Patescibacteria group bacterium]
MKKSIHMILTLSIVGIISGAALVGVYQYTHPLIEKNKEEALQRAIFEVLPEAKDYDVITYNTVTKEVLLREKDYRSTTEKEKVVYRGLDSSGAPIGYALEGEGAGYQGEIKIMIGIDPGLNNTIGIEILESVETPGLGAKITSPWFKDQFNNLKILPLVELIKNKLPFKPNQVQAITGATISSQAVVDIVNKTLKQVREILS